MAEADVVVDRRLDLLVHGLLHLALGVSAVAVEDHQEDHDGYQGDDQKLSVAIAVVTDVEGAHFVVVLEIWVL